MNTLLLAAFLMIPGFVYAQTQTGGISGRVLDVDGTPAVGVMINVVAAKDPKEFAGGSVTIGVVSFQNQTDKDGRFRLPSIPAGRYYVVAGPSAYATYYPGVPSETGATLVTVADGSVLEGLDFKMTRPSGFKVSGHVTRPLDPRPGSPSNATTVVIYSGYFRSPANSIQANIAPDGTFEFQKVASGTYYAALNNAPRGWTPLVFFVTDHDISGVDLVAPTLAEVTTRFIVQNNGPIPRPTLSFSGVNGGQLESALPSPPSGASMKATLFAGEYRVVLTGLSSAYSVKSITFGSTDLLKESLKITDVNPVEIVVTLGLTPGIWVAVRGHVTRPPNLYDRTLYRVDLNSPGQLAVLSAPIAADGSFEFPMVPAGSYTCDVQSSLLQYRPVPVTVADKDVENVTIVIPRQIEIRGRLSIEGGGPMIEPRLFMRSPFGNIQLSTNRAGTLNVSSLPEGEYRFIVEGLPEGYYVKSSTYGATDLLKDIMNLGKGPDNAEVQIVLATRSPR